MGNTLTTSVAWDLGIQTAGFTVATALGRTERFYDLLGSLTYLVLAFKTLPANGTLRHRANSYMVMIWAARLGSYLAYRGFKHGDRRFAKAKKDLRLFALYWFMQAVWVVLTMLPVLLLNSSVDAPADSEQARAARAELSAMDYAGWALWIVGFVSETLADLQKWQFDQAGRPGGFIRTGLWSLSRHPNYAGEITLWFGLCLSCMAGLDTPRIAASTLSPAFVYWLLTRVSGVPLLERAAKKRFGDNPAYARYVNATPCLFPFGRAG